MADLTSHDRAEMFALFTRHFDRAERQLFEADLQNKDWVIRIVDSATGRLCGFSTQVLVKLPHGNEVLTALFSGDTIVDPECWSESALVREWGRLAVELIEATHPEPLYWFLISKGYKTYRFLPVFFHEFYPRYDRRTPVWAKALIDALGRCLYADGYESQREFVISSHKDRLRPGVADITSHRLKDPHVRFFAELNPHHARGDELCCLAPLNIRNFTAAGIRLLDPENRPVPRAARPGFSNVR